MKFTFKKHPKEKGLAHVAHPYPVIDIKLDKKIIGTIYPPNWDSADRVWKVSVRKKVVPTPADPCAWKNITFKARFLSEDKAREWVESNLESALDLNDIELSPQTD